MVDTTPVPIRGHFRRQSIDQGGWPTMHLYSSSSPIECAAAHGHTQIVKVLIQVRRRQAVGWVRRAARSAGMHVRAGWCP